ncbi:YbaB/EbfC family nucleoid-associated protein [Winogradskyella psychrotolerans]|uniref:YbaB/EbfC family nucleoid-associated protein n=1 Tax=Winogradskyella psychrotolerans TaxID=1344585 RepID=UPI001C067349|nr:YbaB/EbfC family nucleoid-associated protein [Winogradskyella psychrotolerans]MBU2930237.1 YbaB/EbfC family nucleoid-associated protein [Winogradskyella psychrotolerans]
MFGDMMGMMGKLKEAQKKVEATKERLHTVLIDETSSDNKLKVTITANRTLKSIDIADELLQDKDMLEDYLILTLNKAIEKATNVHESEVAAVAKEGMPSIPGMDMFK